MSGDRGLARLALALGLSLALGACGGDDGPPMAGAESQAAAEAVSEADASVEGLEAEMERAAAQLREETNAPDLDVCALLDTEALIEAMPNPDGEEIAVVSREGLFGPQCSFRGGRAADQLTARIGASSLSVEEQLGVNQDAPELTTVGNGVRHYFNENFTDQRSYVFRARDLTFQITTEFDDEDASRQFARRAVAMLRR